jgi:hypothetical protein
MLVGGYDRRYTLKPSAVQVYLSENETGCDRSAPLPPPLPLREDDAAFEFSESPSRTNGERTMAATGGAANVGWQRGKSMTERENQA